LRNIIKKRSLTHIVSTRKKLNVRKNLVQNRIIKRSIRMRMLKKTVTIDQILPPFTASFRIRDGNTIIYFQRNNWTRSRQFLTTCFTYQASVEGARVYVVSVFSGGLVASSDITYGLGSQILAGEGFVHT